MKLWLGLLVFIAACTGSTELEKDYQMIFGIKNIPTAAGILSNCSTPLTSAGGLLKIDSRKLETISPSGNCQFIAMPSAPFDLERSVQVPTESDKSALFVSLPVAQEVRSYDNLLSQVVWAFPSSQNPLPLEFNNEFCPTELGLSSSNTQISGASEALLVVLDDPQDPSSNCLALNRDPRVIILERSGKIKGWLKLDFAARINGQIKIAASNTDLFFLYADNGSAYRIARLAISSIVVNTPTSALLLSPSIPDVSSNINTNIALGFSNTGLQVVIGGNTGKIIPVSIVENKFVIGAQLRETTETSEAIGSSLGLFWNRETGTSNLTLYARERQDLLLRRTKDGLGEKINRNLSTKQGVFTLDTNFWGINNNSLYRLDLLNFPNIQTSRAPIPIGDAELTSISWVQP